MHHLPYKMKQWKHWRLSAGFRLILWWGAEQVMQFRLKRRMHNHAVQRITEIPIYPEGEWIVDKSRCFFMTLTRIPDDFKIFELPVIHKN